MLIIIAEIFAAVACLFVFGLMAWIIWSLFIWADFEDHKYDRK